MEERNLCHEVGCPDLCCRSPIRAVILQKNLHILPSDAKHVGYWNIEEMATPGLYFTEFNFGSEKRLYIRIVFPKEYCPDHTNTGCGIYHQQRWPWCQITPINGQECDKFRNAYPLLRKQLGPVLLMTPRP